MFVYFGGDSCYAFIFHFFLCISDPIIVGARL